MKLHIHELILWPEDSEKKPITIGFPKEKVAVITGWSETGKSSILSIIDYVLGSGRAAIPVGPIRETVAWFGLRIETATGIIRVARRKPDRSEGSSEFEVLTHDQAGRSVDEFPNKNQNLDDFKSFMNGLCGLSDLPLATGEQAIGYNLPSGFRDMAAFTFLPQHIVANPHTLFFKTDTTTHRQKLSNAFPVVLGAKSNDQLLQEHRLADLKQQEKQIGAELRRRQASIDTWRAEVMAYYLRAQELNLLADGNPPTRIEVAISLLQELVNAPRKHLDRPPMPRTTAAVQRLEQLRNEEEGYDRKLGDARRQLARVRALKNTISEYGVDLVRERERLKAYDWFAQTVQGEHECPMCGSTQTSAADAISKLRAPIEDLERISSAAINAKPQLDGEILELERRARESEKNVFATRRLRIGLEAQVELDDQPTAGQRLEDVYEFIGSIRQALKSIREVEDRDGLAEKYSELVRKIQLLDAQVDLRGQKAKLEKAQKRIGELIQENAIFLELGHANVRPVLDIKELNLRFIPPNAPEREKGVLLWEIGSGANWMGYHLATFLAIHEFLASREEFNPVPTFLVIDQPSQVFFPSDTYRERIEMKDYKPMDNETPSDDISQHRSDIAKTRKIFELLAKYTQEKTLDLQIIVLEHADERTWNGFESQVVKIRDWRSSGEKLIPDSWIKEQ
jgi:hypothetical protein